MRWSLDARFEQESCSCLGWDDNRENLELSYKGLEGSDGRWSLDARFEQESCSCLGRDDNRENLELSYRGWMGGLCGGLSMQDSSRNRAPA